MFRSYKALIGGILLMIALLGAVSWWIQDRIENAARVELGHSLNTLLVTTHQAVRGWLDEHQNSARVLANKPQVQQAAESLLALSQTRQALVAAPAQRDVREWLAPITKIKGYLGYSIIDRNQINLASSRDQNLGILNPLASQEQFFQRIRVGETAVSAPIKSNVPLPDEQERLRAELPTMFVGAPILDTAGRVIAAFTFRLDPALALTRIMQLGRMGPSGETYAFDARGRLISDSRFDQELRDIGLLAPDQRAILNIEIRDPGVNLVAGERAQLPRSEQPLTRMAEQAVAGHSGMDLTGYRDYRGVPVVGAWVWDPELNFGITTELDVEHAYATVKSTQLAFSALTTLAVLLLLGLAVIALMNRERRQTKKALRISDERFQLAMEAASDGLWDWNILTGDAYHGPRYMAMLGYTPNELPHRLETFEKLVHPQDLPHVNAVTKAHLEHGPDAYEFVFRMRKKDGDYCWILSRGKVVARDAGGEPLRAIGTHIDITEKKQEAEKFRVLFEHSSEAHLIIDETGIIDCNQAAVELFGRDSKTELLGLQLQTLSPERQTDGRCSLEKCAEMNALARHEGYNQFDWVYARASGESFPAEVTLSPIVINEKEITLAVLHDLTARKRAEEEMRLARELAEEANRAKGEFLANMSHEIRTPMNAIIGMTHLALQTDLDAKQSNYLQKVDGSAHALLQIINDILDFSKIEAGKLNIEHIDFQLEDVLDNLSSLIGLKAHNKGLELLFSVEPNVPTALVGDPLRLGQVLLNLVSNAVKFTESGEVVIVVQRVEKHDNQVTLRFAVRDTGIGLSREQIARLFQSFTQANGSTSRKFGGTGLGLAISKRLVEIMGGEIWVDSETGVGSTFSFTVLLGSQTGTERSRTLPVTDLGSMRMLIVDDNATSRQILKDILESLDFEVALATSGEEAITEVIQAAENRPYDLVLMDWKMPGINGVEAARRIKANTAMSKAPKVILVTAYGREDVMHDAQQAELDGFLLKPVSSSVLFDTILSTFGRQVPKQAAATPKRKHAAQPAGSARGARILLVEDNQINQEVAMEILTQAGLVVTIANNGKEALAVLECAAFDGVLMDVQMPEMDGYAVTRALRGQERWQNLPVIAMTANAMAGDREKCLQAGMNDYVSKPVDPDELLAIIERWVKPTQPAAAPSAATQSDYPGEAPPELSALQGIDIVTGLQRVRGNQGLYTNLLRQFAADHVDDVTAIRAALDAGDRKLAQRLAHTLKGAAGNLAATELYTVAKDVETGLKTTTVDAPLLQLNELQQVLVETTQTIDSVLPKQVANANTSSETIALLPDQARRVGEGLREAAEVGDVLELNAIAQALPADSPYSRKLVTLTQAFDTDGILRLADELQRQGKRQ